METSPLFFDAILGPEAVFHSEIIAPKPQRRLISINAAFASNCANLGRHKWQCHGFDVDRTRYYALPEFALGLSPVRIDVFVPDPLEYNLEVGEDEQKLDNSFSGQVMSQSGKLGELIHALDNWSSQVPDFENIYMGMPFGSRILAQSNAPHGIELQPIYEVENRMHDWATLTRLWGMDIEPCPERLDLSELQLVSQPHEAISIVTIFSRHGDQKFAFKSSTSGTRYLYHELHMLLAMPPHPHVICAPLYVVEKRSKFGNRRGICGFLMPYESQGSMMSVLRRHQNSDIPISDVDKLRWAKQVTLGLIHVRGCLPGYYPDLKAENILLADKGENGALDAYLIDFEQRGGWPTRAPPEVYYIDYLEQIALSLRLPSNIKNKYRAKLQEAFPRMSPRDRLKTYDGTTRGFTLSWLSLSPKAQEAAMTFMLGKLIWSIYEEQPESICGLGVDLAQEADPSVRFPTFRLTPPGIRECIRECTAGAPEWQGRSTPLAKRGDKWCIVDVPSVNSEHTDIKSIQQVAKSWWRSELDAAEAYVQSIIDGDERVDTYWRQRPTLRQVLEVLEGV